MQNRLGLGVIILWGPNFQHIFEDNLKTFCSCSIDSIKIIILYTFFTLPAYECNSINPYELFNYHWQNPPNNELWQASQFTATWKWYSWAQDKSWDSNLHFKIHYGLTKIWQLVFLNPIYFLRFVDSNPDIYMTLIYGFWMFLNNFLTNFRILLSDWYIDR